MIYYLPNLISIARILAVPVVVWLILTDEYQAAFWIFAAAGISDAIDGILAKRFNAITVLGSFLDPLADKALLVGVFITMGHQGIVPVWLVILVVFRDFLIIAGALLFLALSQSLIMDPLVISKVNTLAQIVLVGVVLATYGFGFEAKMLLDILIATVAITTVWSGGRYVTDWTRRALLIENNR